MGNVHTKHWMHKQQGFTRKGLYDKTDPVLQKLWIGIGIYVCVCVRCFCSNLNKSVFSIFSIGTPRLCPGSMWPWGWTQSYKGFCFWTRSLSNAAAVPWRALEQQFVTNQNFSDSQWTWVSRTTAPSYNIFACQLGVYLPYLETQTGIRYIKN